MNDQATSNSNEGDFFDQLIEDRTPREHAAFNVAFRGYDRDEVDSTVNALRAEVTRLTEMVDAGTAHTRDELERVREEARVSAEEAVFAATQERDSVGESVRNEMAAELQAAKDQAAAAETARAAAEAQAAEAQEQVAALTEELAGNSANADADDASSRQQFDAVLRVAEEQARSLIQNAAVQSERLLEAAREEVEIKRAELAVDVERITKQAQHDADQVRLKADTEYTAHEARIERESAHAAEKASQAEREAAAIRTEAEKGAATLRAMVTRETTDLKAEAERASREMNARTLEFEESLARRQDEAQQEFLMLHEQAVAHAERITTDANEQVTSSLDHAKRISSKADDYEKVARTQSQAIDADAQARARETLERARVKAQKIVDTVSEHTNAVLRDAEDRARQLRWQQQQMTSFMAEVRELMRPDGVLGAGAAIEQADDELEDDETLDEVVVDAEEPSGE